MATTPVVTGWDAQGKPINGGATPDAPASAIAGWDAQGNPIQHTAAAPASAPAPRPSGGLPGTGAATPSSANPNQEDLSFTGVGTGVLKAAGQTANTVSRLIHGAGEAIHKGAGEAIVPQAGIDSAEQMETTHGASEGVGAGIENIAEFMMGDEALKGLSLGAKLSKVAPVLKALEKSSPRMVQVISDAIRHGSVATGQGLAHGEDVGTAAGQGAMTALASGAFGGVSQAARQYLDHNMTTLEDVGGVKTPIPAEVRNAKPTPQQATGKQSIANAARGTLAGQLEEVNASRATPANAPALPARTGPYQFQLRGVPPVETTTGESVVPAAKLPRENVSGAPSARNAQQLGTSASTVPGRVAGDEAYMTSPEPVPGAPGNRGATGADVSTETPRQTESASTAGGGTMTTEDPNLVRNHIATLNEIVDHPDFETMTDAQRQTIMEARADAQRQLREYHAEQPSPRGEHPNFPQIDVPATVSQIGSYTEAANHLENIASEGYNSISDALALNDISGGKFNMIRNANKEAWNAYTGANNPAALRTAESAIDDTNRQMVDMLKNDIGGAVTPKELDGFNHAWGMAQKMKYVARAVDGAFSGNASEAARSWEYRGFDGNKLMGNLDRLQQKFGGRSQLERVVGKENLNTLYQVAELNRTGAARMRFGAAIKPIAEWLNKAGGSFGHLAPMALGGMVGEASGIPHGWMLGMAAGEGAALATKKVMNAILTNPKVAENILFVIDSGARPQYYGPAIGAMIQQGETYFNPPQSKEKQ